MDYGSWTIRLLPFGYLTIKYYLRRPRFSKRWA
jgi:hypothetical protein